MKESVVIDGSINYLSKADFSDFDVNEIENISFYASSFLSSIENGIFMGFSSLKFLDFRNCLQLVKIPQQMCYNCRELTIVYLPDDGIIDELGICAFARCTKLEYINIPYSVTVFTGWNVELQSALFGNCNSLKKIHMSPSSRLKYIKAHAFISSGLIEFTIPRSVEHIFAPFVDCKNLTKVVFEEGNPNLYFEDGVVYNIGKTEVYTVLPTYTENITILPSVVLIGEQAFRECKIKNLIFTEGITTINRQGFQYSVEYLYIPSTVTSLVDYNFDQIRNLKRIEFAGNPSIGVNVFYQKFMTCGLICIDEVFNKLTSLGYSFSRIECPPDSVSPISPSKSLVCRSCPFRESHLSDVLKYIYVFILL